ncbi:MAG TPA: hypothetical protein PLK27_08020, partial [Neisseria sp.]|nr:hypothetical protein [Neisseria sp.]
NKQAAVAANEKAAADLQKSVAALPKGADIDTDAEVQALNAAMNAYNSMNDAQKSWVDAATVANLQAISTGAIFDSEATRMAARKPETPLPDPQLGDQPECPGSCGWCSAEQQ